MSLQLTLFRGQAGFGLFISVTDGGGITLGTAGTRAGASDQSTIWWV